MADANAALSTAIDALLDVADDLNDEKVELNKKVSANRDMLRGYVNMGVANAEQTKAIKELYPDRTRTAKPAAAAPTK